MTFEEVLIRLGIDGSSIKAGLRSVEDQVKVGAEKIAGSYKEAFTKAGAAGVAMLGFDKLKELVAETIQWGREISKASEEMGISTDFFQGLGSAARKSGEDIDRVSSAMMRLNLKISEAQNGNDEAQNAFKKWGINYDGKTTEEVFMQMVKLRDATNEDAMFFDLLGRNYRAAMDVARLGVEGLADTIKNTSKLTEDQSAKLLKLSTLTTGFWKNAKLAMAEILTLGMETPAPAGMTEAQLNKRVEDEAKKRGIDLNDKRVDNSGYNGSWAPSAYNTTSEGEKARAALRREVMEAYKKEQEAAKVAEDGKRATATHDKAIAKAREEADKAQDAAQNKELNHAELIAKYAKEKLTALDKFKKAGHDELKQEEARKEYWNAEKNWLEEKGRLEKEQAAERKKAAAEEKRAAKESEQTARRLTETSRDLAVAQRNRAESLIDPYLPTIEQLSKSDAWTRRKGLKVPAWWVRDAREIESLEKDAPLAVGKGNLRRAHWDAQRIDYLKSGLEEAGFIKNDRHLESIDDRIAKLQETWTRLVNGEDILIVDSPD